MTRDVPGIEGMRGLAALIVVLFHALLFYVLVGPGFPGGPLANVTAAGWIGVDFFFVLSAFLLSLPVFLDPSRIRQAAYWKNYIAKRFLRIAPAYYASIFFVMALFAAWDYPVVHAKDTLLHGTFLHSFDREAFLSINPAYWSLAVEFQFYLVLPLMAWMLSGRRAWFGLPAFLAIGLAWRWLTYSPDALSTFWLGAQLPAFLPHFAFGILAARLFASARRLAAPAWVGVVASLATIAVPLIALGDGLSRMMMPNFLPTLVGHLFLRTTIGLGFAGLLYFSVVESRALAARFFASATMRNLGRMSYSLYLVHMPIIVFLTVHTPFILQDGLPVMIVATLLATLPCAWMFHKLVEGPFLRIKVRMFSDVPAQGPLVSTPQTPAPAGA